jgi:serine/threonine protein kinase
MELGKICSCLVRYYNVFEEGDYEIIVMDYLENGDLQSYIKKVGKLNEEVNFYFKFYFIYFRILNVLFAK